MDLSKILDIVWIYSTGWGLWVSGGMYLWFAACLMTIARKSHVPGWWVGWVPVVNFWIVCAAGKASSAWFWRLVVSFAAIILGIVLRIPLWLLVWLVLWGVAWAVVWGRVAHERGHSAALGLLSPVPVLSLVLFGLLAFDD